MLTVQQTTHATELAAEIVDKICVARHNSQSVGCTVYRSPEQIALIVELINTAIDPMLALNVGTVEAIAEPIKFTPCRECHGTPGNLEVSVMHEGNIEKFSNFNDAFKFIDRKSVV